jgi:hypothetical protein
LRDERHKLGRFPDISENCISIMPDQARGLAMLISLDISIFSSPTSSFANVWGALDLPVLPDVGEDVSFLFKCGVSMPSIIQGAKIVVTSRRIDVDRSPACAIQISDLFAEDKAGAEAICVAFEEAFGFHVDRYPTT